MLVIRFQRTGRKKQPSFRLVVQEKTQSPQSKTVEIVGFYNPRTKEKGFKEDRIKYWIGNGAQATDSVNNLLVNNGIIEGAKRKAVTITKKRAEKLADKKKAEEEKKAAAAEVVAEPIEAPAEEKPEEIKEDQPAETPVVESEVQEPEEPAEVVPENPEVEVKQAEEVPATEEKPTE